MREAGWLTAPALAQDDYDCVPPLLLRHSTQAPWWESSQAGCYDTTWQQAGERGRPWWM